MNSEQKQILLRKKGKKSASGLADSSDSLLDLLCNVVGVLVLVSSLAGVFAATSAVNIQAPMKKETKKTILDTSSCRGRCVGSATCN